MGNMIPEHFVWIDTVVVGATVTKHSQAGQTSGGVYRVFQEGDTYLGIWQHDALSGEACPLLLVGSGTGIAGAAMTAGTKVMIGTGGQAGRLIEADNTTTGADVTVIGSIHTASAAPGDPVGLRVGIGATYFWPQAVGGGE